MSSETTSKPRIGQLDVRRLVALVVVVAVITFGIGVVASQSVARLLTAIGQGFRDIADWIDSPYAWHSGAAIEKNDDYLFSPAEKARIDRLRLMKEDK